MTIKNFDEMLFTMQTKAIQERCKRCAMDKAQLLVSGGSPAPKFMSVTARKISSGAYDAFKEQMQEAFPSLVKDALFELTLISNEKEFFYKLSEDIEKLFTKFASRSVS